ncbi:MAG: DUF3108 domain-containing protein [Deltaproteobacteria bacterium]|nr:DUF3108 domain-containing protein [Deltaproteobacteria bacterium]
MSDKKVPGESRCLPSTGLWSLPVRIGKAITDIPLGTWVEYEIRTHGDPKPSPFIIWMGVVAKERLENNAKGAWFEFRTTGPMGGIVTKTLLVNDGKGGLRAVKSLISFKNGPAMEIDTRNNSGFSGPSQCGQEAAGSKTRNLGVQTIKVPAGTFKARHVVTKFMDGSDMHYWFSKKVPVMGIVKSDSAIGIWILKGFGKGAKSAINGPVVKTLAMPRLEKMPMPKKMVNPKTPPTGVRDESKGSRLPP